MKCTDDFILNKNKDRTARLSLENDAFFNVNLSVHKLFHPRNSAPSYFNEDRKCRAVKRRRFTVACVEDINKTTFPNSLSTVDTHTGSNALKGCAYLSGLYQNGSLKSTNDAFNFNLNTSITKRKKQNIYNWEVYRWSPVKEKNKIIFPSLNRNALRKSVEETIRKSVAIRHSIKSNFNKKNVDSKIGTTDITANNIRKNCTSNMLHSGDIDKYNDNKNIERSDFNTVDFLDKNRYYLNRTSEGTSSLGTVNEMYTDMRGGGTLKHSKPLQDTYIMSNTTQSDNNCFKNKNTFRESFKTQRDTENVFVNSESTISSFLMDREKHDLSQLCGNKNRTDYMENDYRRELRLSSVIDGERKYNSHLLHHTLLSSDFMRGSNHNPSHLLGEREGVEVEDEEEAKKKVIARKKKLSNSYVNELPFKKRHSTHIPNYYVNDGFTELEYHPPKRVNDGLIKNEYAEESEEEEEEEEEIREEENSQRGYNKKKKVRRHSDAVQYVTKHTKSFNNLNNLKPNSNSLQTDSLNVTNPSANSNYYYKYDDRYSFHADAIEHMVQFGNVEPSVLNELSKEEVETVRKMKLSDRKRKHRKWDNNAAFTNAEEHVYDEFGRKIKQETTRKRPEPFSEKNGEGYIFSKNYFADIIACLHNKTLIEVICKLKENARCVISKSLFKKLEENTKDRENKYPADFFFLYRHLGEVVDDAEYKKHLKKERNESCYLDVPFSNLREIMNLEPVQTFDETDDSDEYHEVEVKLLENYYCRLNGKKSKHLNIFEESKITAANIVIRDNRELEKLRLQSQLHSSIPTQSLSLSNSSVYSRGLVHKRMMLHKNEKEMKEREEQLIAYMQKTKAEKDAFYNSISNEQNYAKIQHTVLTTNENFILSGHLFNIHFSPKYGPVVYLLKCEDDKYYYRTIEISRNLETRARELLDGKREYYRKGKKELNCQNKNSLCVLFTESDIKNVLYVPMSCGWSHYGYFKDQCNVLFFRRPKKG